MKSKRVKANGDFDIVKFSCVLLAASLVYMILFAYIALADVPSGSIVIYGLNGTDITGSRNVFLNLTAGTSDGIEACRWANDAAGNLAAELWENCTTVKAWILSSGFGTKSVYYQIRDQAGHTNTLSDTINYTFIQDFTPPTPPTVYDGTGDDIDWWNSNTTLYANWFNATDDISTIHYMYRILNNSACFGACSWTDTGTGTSAAVPGLALAEGRNFSFEVIAYAESGLNASVATSDGARIDLTKPDDPVVESSTHPTQTQPYDSVRAILNFSGTDPLGGGVASGVEGFSYLLDRHPGTAPDNIMEERFWLRLFSGYKGSYNQTLKVNGSAASDDAYAVFSQLHTNISVGDSMRVRVALAEQFSDYSDEMNVMVYLIKFTEGADIDDFSQESNAVSNIENVSWDIRYAETMELAKYYQFDLTVNESVNDNTEDIYVVVSGWPDDDDNMNPLAIAATTNEALIDNSTKNYVCDEGAAAACPENTSTLDYAIKVEQQDSGSDWFVVYDYLGDDTYYFHVKSKDYAGNWGDTTHYRLMVAAGGVSSLIYSPVDGSVVLAQGSEVNITVSVAVSVNASVWIVAEHPDGSNYPSPKQIVNTTYEFENITLELGSNEIYAVTNSSAGAIAYSPSIFVTASTDVLPATNKTIGVTYTGCGIVSAHLCNRDEGTVAVGIATETAGAISGSRVAADTTYNSMKLYMTRDTFESANIESQFSQNTFLDRVHPMFGYTRGADIYVIRQELRYRDIYLGGSFTVSAGAHNIFIRKVGLTPDGYNNITLVIE
jgi:hypothetical protein